LNVFINKSVDDRLLCLFMGKDFFFFELHERKNTSAPEKFLPTLSTIYITHFLLDWISMTQSFHIQ